MSHTFVHCLTHVVFGTKERRPCIEPAFRPDLHAYVGGIIRNLGGTAIAINGVADHVHLLLHLRPTLALSRAMNAIKASSSKWAHERKRRDFGWQQGYAAFAVSRSNEERVVQYIANQEVHHQRVSFRDEYVRLLEKSGIAFDERYLFE